MTNLLKRRGTEMIAQMAWRYLEGDPEENLPKLLKFIESVDIEYPHALTPSFAYSAPPAAV